MSKPIHASLLTAEGEVFRPELYDPAITFADIYFPHPAVRPLLKYNHDVDIVKFRDRFYACWNANETGAEHVPGQFNFLSYSDDFVHWSKPIRLFTADSGSENPIEDDNQWQPSFINYNDEVLYCAWCTFNGEKTFVSSSTDGIHWVNREVPSAPSSLKGQVVGFPTTHGLLTRDNVMLFPCSLPNTGSFIVGDTRYAAVLRSEDGGASWQWSEPIEGIRWEQIGEDPGDYGTETIIMWEPVLFEQADGRIGLLVRNSTSQDNPDLIARPELDKPHYMLLYAYSDDLGMTWSPARPIEVDSIISRPYAASGIGTQDSLLMAMNDMWVNTPKRMGFDRYQLSLYFAPICNPDLLLPGPLVQPEGGRAYYPNGFVDGNKLYVAYTFAGIHSATVEPLPDFGKPFLLPRESRRGLRIEGHTATLGQKHTGLGLVLTEELTVKPRLRLAFELSLHRYNGTEFTLLTLGGKTHSGCTLSALYSEECKSDVIRVRLTDGRSFALGEVPLRTWLRFVVEFEPGGFTVRLNDGAPVSIHGALLRKIFFGGLYTAPEWPVGMSEPSDIRLRLDSIALQ
ncbi:MAG: hypothetical protein K0Q94_2472 [Paenibacillus sp.]|jgi:hypothetical protein|nr:hypothetical protein [Paenibacillus sp.]